VQVVLLAGGMGTRLREETEYRPKPMVEIGGRPILWHIMKNFATQGHNEFILCLGYKGDFIKDYFLNYESRASDITLSLGSKTVRSLHNTSDESSWTITLANTGLLTPTGGRISKINQYITGDKFLCTYGDGLANVDLEALLAFHDSHGKIATVTTVQPTNRFGALELNSEGLVTRFNEKPKSENWINGGFFVFDKRIFSYLSDSSTLEQEPLNQLVKDEQLVAFKHLGFWQPMDTYRESTELNEMWDKGNAPWKTWRDE
jgi:glucose-1-phosphate cytidylyltransferase